MSIVAHTQQAMCGYTFVPLVHRPTGKRYLGAKPSDKALTRLREKIRSILSPWNTGTWEETAAHVNRLLKEIKS